MKIYCLSGLGVDKKAFQNLKAEGIELIHIDWIRPEKSESLEHYAKRLFDLSNLPHEYNLLGLSFGGMIATEFSKIRKPKNLYLISTICTRAELRPIFKLIGFLRLHRIVPTSLLKSSNFITNYFFGVKTEEEKKLLKQILKETDSYFLRWALHAILTWKNTDKPSATSIHGTRDKILPIQKNTDYIISGGGHFMIVGRGKEISEILKMNNGL
jgi:pimeloyl-ACP methyl ester carboxylesterase